MIFVCYLPYRVNYALLIPLLNRRSSTMVAPSRHWTHRGLQCTMRCTFAGLPPIERFAVRYGSVETSGNRGSGKCRERFPPNTRGVFYFRDRTSIHPLAGDIRFRVLPVDTIRDWNSANVAELFVQGHVLLNCDDDIPGPWSILLLSIIRTRRLGIYTFMKNQGLITEEVEQQVQRLKLAAIARSDLLGGNRQVILHQVTDAFALELPNTSEAS